MLSRNRGKRPALGGEGAISLDLVLGCCLSGFLTSQWQAWMFHKCGSCQAGNVRVWEFTVCCAAFFLLHSASRW